MKNSLKNRLIIIAILVGIIILDSIQALVFDNSPLFKIREYYNGGTLSYKDKGFFVDVYYCGNGMHDTVIKGFSYSCSYNGGNYTLIDKSKEKINFSCAEALESFYEDDNYIYFWNCMKNKYMIVKYEDGYEETIKDALKNNHINIGDLDKFKIDYVKVEKNVTYDELNKVNDKIIEFFALNGVSDYENYSYNYVDVENSVVVVGLLDNSVEKQKEFRSLVVDSDLIKFEKGERAELSDE